MTGIQTCAHPICPQERLCDKNCPCDCLVYPAPLQIPAGLNTIRRQIAGFPEFRRAMLAAIPQARLLSRTLQLSGTPTDRARIHRHYVGADVSRPFSPFLGLTRCVTEAPDIRELWDRLLTFEAACDDTLRGHQSTVLDIPGGHGKVPVGPDYVCGRADAGTFEICDVDGARHAYSDGETPWRP